MSATTYVIGNFKGGVGKSTTAQMLGFESAIQKERKTLIIDLDMQANTTDVMELTRDNFSDTPMEIDLTITDVLMHDADVHDAIYNVVPNLDILASDISLADYSTWIVNQFPAEKDQLTYLEDKLSILKEEYDVIYVDVPPSISVYSKSAIFFSEFAIIVLQTQVKSLKNAKQYLDFIQMFNNLFDRDIKVAGIIPFMISKRSGVDEEVYEAAKEMYGDYLLKSVVYQNDRLKRYDGSGITMELRKDGQLMQWDERAHELFMNILEEIDDHVEILRGDD